MAGDIQKARVLLTAPVQIASPWSALAAAALAATAAILMAGVMVLGPGVRFQNPVPIDQALLPNG